MEQQVLIKLTVRRLNPGILVSSAGTADMPHTPVWINVQPVGNLAASAVKITPFAALCRQKTVHTAEDANNDSDDGEDFYIECIYSTTQKDQGFVELTCNGTKIPFKIDTGAQVNVLPKSDFDKLSIHQLLTQMRDTPWIWWPGTQYPWHV